MWWWSGGVVSVYGCQHIRVWYDSVHTTSIVLPSEGYFQDIIADNTYDKIATKYK
jgi:hypothetical protein